MVDVDDPDRDKAERIFRGVASNDYQMGRKGEIFGMSNLLRYEDGKMRKYGAEAKEAKDFGHGIYSMESIAEAAQTAPDDEDVEDLSGGHIVADPEPAILGISDIAKRNEKSTYRIEAVNDVLNAVSYPLLVVY
jgi:hypothetical protein